MKAIQTQKKPAPAGAERAVQRALSPSVKALLIGVAGNVLANVLSHLLLR